MTTTPDTARTAPAPKGTGTLVTGDGARHARIWGVGGYRPERVVPNSELVDRIDSSDEWIRERSGIISRRYAAPEETVVDMAEAAARQALEAAGDQRLPGRRDHHLDGHPPLPDPRRRPDPRQPPGRHLRGVRHLGRLRRATATASRWPTT